MPIEIKVKKIEAWDQVNEEFVWLPSTTLVLEHSLLSISKWESKWKKPFLGKDEKTNEQVIDYIKCMAINKKTVNDLYFSNLSVKDIRRITDYIGDSMTATWFNEQNMPRGSRMGEVVTSELIYYWLVQLGIPFEVEKWHLNRLLTLVQICNIKQQKPKKMSKKDIMQQNAALNRARRAKAGLK